MEGGVEQYHNLADFGFCLVLFALVIIIVILLRLAESMTMHNITFLSQ